MFRAAIHRHAQPPIDLTGKTSTADLPALLSQCHVFIGNDSGAMHVAAAVGLPDHWYFWPNRSVWVPRQSPRGSTIVRQPTLLQSRAFFVAARLIIAA